jgi:hypothetical protein
MTSCRFEFGIVFQSKKYMYFSVQTGCGTGKRVDAVPEYEIDSTLTSSPSHKAHVFISYIMKALAGTGRCD